MVTGLRMWSFNSRGFGRDAESSGRSAQNASPGCHVTRGRVLDGRFRVIFDLFPSLVAGAALGFNRRHRSLQGSGSGAEPCAIRIDDISLGMSLGALGAVNIPPRGPSPPTPPLPALGRRSPTSRNRVRSMSARPAAARPTARSFPRPAPALSAACRWSRRRPRRRSWGALGRSTRPDRGGLTDGWAGRRHAGPRRARERPGDLAGAPILGLSGQIGGLSRQIGDCGVGGPETDRSGRRLRRSRRAVVHGVQTGDR